MGNSEEFENKVIADLAVLKASMKTLVGNGQPGRISKIEDRVFWLILTCIVLALGSGAPAVLAMLK